jgi:glycosyltransferase involved in cell wall biosynthesis
MIDLSIIVCSYNRCDHLRALLNSVSELVMPEGLSWEILVVDNNSADATAATVREFCLRDPRHFRYEFESRQGKSFALNTAVEKSHGRILAFTDDDAILPSDWGTTVIQEFAADADLSGLGGRVELYRGGDDSISTRRDMTRRVLSADHFPADNIPIIGCNMAMRRGVFDAIGGFETRLGPGAKAGVGEDLDFLYRAYRAGLKIVYSPNVRVFHDHGRRNQIEIDRVKRGYIVGRGGFYWKHVRCGDLYAAKLAIWEINGVLRRAWHGALTGAGFAKELSVLANLFGGAVAFGWHKRDDSLGRSPNGNAPSPQRTL